MIGLIKALGVAKTALAVTALTAATAFATQVALPAAANLGQAHAAAGAANATTPDAADHATNTTPTVADPASGQDVAAIQARLAANKGRLLANLEAVLTRLQANPKVNTHAIAAIQKRILVLTNNTSGLDRASTAVGGAGGSGNATQPTLSTPAQNHPSAGNHPTKP